MGTVAIRAALCYHPFESMVGQSITEQYSQWWDSPWWDSPSWNSTVNGGTVHGGTACKPRIGVVYAGNNQREVVPQRTRTGVQMASLVPRPFWEGETACQFPQVQTVTSAARELEDPIRFQIAVT